MSKSSFIQYLPCSKGLFGRIEIQQVNSALDISSRTPMGNLLMIEPLLSSFKDFEQSQMVTTASQCLFLPKMKPSPQPFPSKK